MENYTNTEQVKEKIICAIDTSDIGKVKELVSSLGGTVGAIKLGLEFFVANGAEAVREISKIGVPIFLDLKFHDIPNTVAGAIREAVKLDVFMITIHTSGGKQMMERAAACAREMAKELGKKPPLIVGVTILTSLSEDDFIEIGFSEEKVSDQVLKLANLAKESGLDGIVCSPHEIRIIRENLGEEFKLVVPGIRPATHKAGTDDQSRIMTPRDAILSGADYLVIGRPITASSNPAKSAREILKGMEG